jgi:hypothetical protein
MVVKVFVFYCPACNQKIESLVSTLDAEELTKEHVSLAHPDFDPEWYITYPDGLKYEGAPHVRRPDPRPYVPARRGG